MSAATMTITPRPSGADRRALSTDVLVEALSQALDHVGATLLLVDQDGALLFANARGQSLLANGLAVWGGRLAAAYTTGTRALRAAISAAAGPRRLTTTVALEGLHDVLRLMATPLSNSVEQGPTPVILIACHQEATIEAARLGQAFDLTPAEARLLSALVGGERIGAYARRTGVSVNTAKTHLRQLFSKTGEQRQAGLIRLALTDPVLRLVATSGR